MQRLKEYDDDKQRIGARARPTNLTNLDGIPPGVQRVLKRHNVDMTFEMLQVMNCLWNKQGISQQSLAEKTAKDKACLTNLINNLEKKNWVIRKEGPSDRRNRLIFLTPQGEELALTVKPLINDIYAQTGTEMEASRITECIEDLKRLHEVLNEI